MIALDTNVFVALADHRDPLRERAARDLQTLIGKPMSTFSATLAETFHLLPHAGLRARVRALIDELEIQPLEESSRALWTEAFDWLEQYSEHGPDWVDACLAVASGRDRKLRVWTYDREFVTTWRRPDGTRIPLAVPIG